MKWGWVVLLLSLTSSWAQTYQVEGKVVYEARGPLGAFRGTNEAVSGTLTLNLEAKTLQGRVCLDLARFDSGEPLRDQHTRRMFEVEKYPEACLELKGFKGDPRQGEVSLLGELSLHGVRRPVEIPGKVQLGPNVVFEGAFETRITEWQMKRPSVMGFTVADQVKVFIYGRGVRR